MIIELLEYTFSERNGQLVIDFKFNGDPPDSLRQDIFNIEFIEDYGFKPFQKEEGASETYLEDDFDDEDLYSINDFLNSEINEQVLVEFLKTYYKDNPDELPKLNSF